MTSPESSPSGAQPQPDQFNSNGQNNGTLHDIGQPHLLHQRQWPDRDSQPRYHQRQPGRMVLRHGTLVHDSGTIVATVQSSNLSML